MKLAADDVQSLVIPGSGHYVRAAKTLGTLEPMRGALGDRPAGLHREDPGRIAAALSWLAAAAHRW